MNQLSSEVFRAVKLVRVILHWWARVTLHLSKPMGCIATSEWEWCISVGMHSSGGVSESRSVVSDSLWPHGLFSPWNFPGQNTGMIAIPFCSGYSQPRDQTPVSHITGSFLFFCFYQLSHQGSLHNSSGDAENVGGYAYVKAGSLL